MNEIAATVTPAHAGPPIVRLIRLLAKRAALWMRHLWQQDSTSPDQGLAITHGEVDRILRDPSSLAAERDLFFAQDPQAQAITEEIVRGEIAVADNGFWSWLCKRFDLTREESDLLALATAIDLEPELGRVCAYLHDDVQASRATEWLAAHLFQWPNGTTLRPQNNVRRWRLAQPVGGTLNPWSIRTPWVANPAVALSVREGVWRDPTLGHAVILVDVDEPVSRLVLHPDVLDRTVAFAQAIGDQAAIELELLGPRGSGKRTLAAQFARRLNRPLLVADIAELCHGERSEAAQEKLVACARFAKVHDAIVLWRAADAVDSEVWRATSHLVQVAISDHEEALPGVARANVARQSFRLPPLDSAGREALWATISNGAVMPAIVRERRLLASEIAAVSRVAHVGDQAMRQASQANLQPPGELLQILPRPYTRSDLVLSAETRRQLDEFEEQAKRRWAVLEGWGFGRIASPGRGISALLAGPSGTGKTMAAQVIARALDLDLVRVDLAGVVNKYIGETEKRLKQVFDYCERAGVMLFFDEADALFGQRMQVKDAHDRFANIEIDYLLQRMEQFGGIAVLATNRKNDLDTAFLRRIQFVVDFLPPGVEERLQIWHAAVGESSPFGSRIVGDLDWTLLAEKLVMSGAEIKAAALGAAFLAHADGTPIAMRHVLHAARRELVKRGAVLRVNLGEAS